MSLTPDTLVVGLGIFLVLWYLGASIYNRRRGIAIYRWMRAGLEEKGSQISGRWIGSSGSGAELKLQNAEAPFRSLDVIYLLASRELLPLFLFDIVRGKTDRLIVRCSLRSNPASELEVVRAGSSLARQMSSATENKWHVEDGPGDLVSGGRGPNHSALRSACLPLLEKYGQHLVQLSWGKKAPHLIAIFSLDRLFSPDTSTADLLDDLAGAVNRAAGKS